MKICIAGKNNIAVNALEYLVKESGLELSDIAACPNKNDAGSDSWQKSLKKAAGSLGVKIIQLEDAYNIEDLIFISLECDKIIPVKKFKSKRLYNIRFSLLPEYKGMFTSVLPILNGRTKSGVTLHIIEEGIDTGDIIDQIEFDLDIKDTARDLYDKFLNNAFELFKKNIKNLIEGNFAAAAQPNINSTYYSKKALDYSNIKIDFNKTSFEIYNQIRAFIFPEYQLSEIEGRKIYKAELTDKKTANNTLIMENDKFLISGIDGYLIRVFIKPENPAGGGGRGLVSASSTYCNKTALIFKRRFYCAA